MHYRIDRATPADIDDIVRFQRGIIDETEPEPVDTPSLREGVRRVFDTPAIGFYLVARAEDGASAGCLLVQREWSDWRNTWVLWVHSVYVAPEHRRRGVLQSMFAYAESLAREEGAAGLRLLTDRANTTAHGAYHKAGYIRCHYDVMEKLFG